MNDPTDPSKGYVLEVLTTPYFSVIEVFNTCLELAESTSRALNSSGEYSTYANSHSVIDTKTSNIIVQYYIVSSKIETFE